MNQQMYIYKYVTAGSSFYVDNADDLCKSTAYCTWELDLFSLGTRLLYVRYE
jgi:hypothetical protein